MSNLWRYNTILSVLQVIASAIVFGAVVSVGKDYVIATIYAAIGAAIAAIIGNFVYSFFTRDFYSAGTDEYGYDSGHRYPDFISALASLAAVILSAVIGAVTNVGGHAFFAAFICVVGFATAAYYINSSFVSVENEAKEDGAVEPRWVLFVTALPLGFGVVFGGVFFLLFRGQKSIVV